MAKDIKVPKVGESITEVQIAKWLKAEGDAVKRDETLATLETDKTTVELSSPGDGVLGKILKGDGAMAQVGEVVASLEPESTRKGVGDSGKQAKEEEREEPMKPAKVEKSSKQGEPEKSEKPEKLSETGEEKIEAETDVEAKAAPAPVPPAEGKSSEKAAPPEKNPVNPSAEGPVMPAAKRVLAEKGLQASEVAATGHGNRLLKEDVIRAEKPADEPAEKSVDKPAEKSARKSVREDAPAPAPDRSGEATGRMEEAVPMSMLRRRVAERLVRAQQGAALLTTFNEIDMSAARELRRNNQEEFQRKHGVKLGYMSLFVKAVADALLRVRGVNGEIRDDHIILRNYCDIGVAIGSERGLVVPVLRNAEGMGFAEIETALADFSKRAGEGTLKVEELTGGTFTISNGGVFGSLLSTPIVNPPQSGILGMHAIQDRPVARDGEVVIRPMMYVALTYDHRIVDGKEAVTFLKHVKETVEDPASLLLEI
jgi:2-oxoglutarate dehydrogenase E2 component (dihydrolipoamide succinyltransferase)